MGVAGVFQPSGHGQKHRADRRGQEAAPVVDPRGTTPVRRPGGAGTPPGVRGANDPAG
ncbi:hypothetical protein HMPREF0043_01097 [Actinobaculum sp. oral taxon 183 str. F0552]|nr:hypothetical protein HMPREF0043_01097 [Actinobaculum sp. oral taxon 183 str. F0552]